jgi:ABC-type multidrug transport system ATPase subunit
MNGMKVWAYFLSQYVTFLLLYSISAFIFVIAGKLCLLNMLSLTDNGVLFVIFFIWGNDLIALSFLMSNFFNKSRNALIVIFLIVLCSVIVSLALQSLYSGSRVVPSGFFIWPPFAFYRILGRLARATFNPKLKPYSLGALLPGDEVFTAMIYMIVSWPIIIFLSYYLDSVLPSEFGIPKPWHFPITDLIKSLKTKQDLQKISDEEAHIAIEITVDENETKYEDEDVREERRRVCDVTFNDAQYPLVMRNMRKVYAGRGGQGPKLAVKDVTFAVEEGIIFGLLGPNGAGKTTLISILTGLYESSAGEAKIAGFDVKKQTEEVYRRIGICPQFDIHWGELTVGEHLYFYARVKGIQAKDERQAVLDALEEVSLTDFEDRLARGLSGGERRRLSIAMALLGNPKVVFFDEPTTGLDPEVRRLIWDVINKAKKGRTLVLTTHSMEEAEALCQRIGIMAKGTLRCCASLTRLKQLYGSGFKFYMNADEMDIAKSCAFIESILPPGWRKVDSFATNQSYEFPYQHGFLPKLFDQMASQKVGIHDWGVGQTTLEEVFVRLISEVDASPEY